MINVLIADGRRLLREGLAALLSREKSIRVVGESDSGRAALKQLGPLGVDVVLLHAIPPVGETVELLHEVAATQSATRVVVLTNGLSPSAAHALLAAGAMGFLTKECASADLIASIRSAVTGKVFLSPSLTDALVTTMVRPRPSAAGAFSARQGRPLSAREQDVLRRIASGQSTKEIALALGVGSKTVETHRRRLMEKLGRWSVAELTQYAMLEGLIAVGMVEV